MTHSHLKGDIFRACKPNSDMLSSMVGQVNNKRAQGSGEASECYLSTSRSPSSIFIVIEMLQMKMLTMLVVNGTQGLLKSSKFKVVCQCHVNVRLFA